MDARISNFLGSLVAILLGTIILSIFLSWQLVSIIMGTITVVASYLFVVSATGINKKLAGWIAGLIILSLIISFGFSQMSSRLKEAVEERKTEMEYKAIDAVKPRRSLELPTVLYLTKLEEIKKEEAAQVAILNAIRVKMASGMPLTRADSANKNFAEKKLWELDKRREKLKLLPAGKKGNRTASGKDFVGWWNSVANNSTLIKALAFGAFLLILGLMLKLLPEGMKRGGLVYLGFLLIISAIVWSLFSEELKMTADYLGKVGATTGSSSARKTIIGTYRLPADGSVVSMTTDGRTLMERAGGKTQYRQLGNPGRFRIVNHKTRSWETSKTIITSGRVIVAEQVKLASAGGRELLVQVQIK